jgi:tetratricopeptide (TPR) repeat protein
MKKSYLKTAVIFLAGFAVGLSSTSLFKRDDKVKVIAVEQTESHHKVKKAKASLLNKKQHNDHIQVKETKKRTKFFNPERNITANISKLHAQISKMNHFPRDGAPNPEIIELYEEILELNPSNLRALEKYSKYLLVFNRYEDANPLIEKCLSVDPNNESCLVSSTAFPVFQGDMEKAEERVDNCIARRPNNPKCVHLKGNLLLRQNLPSKALSHYKKLEVISAKSKQKVSKALIFLGQAQSYEQLGNNEMAISLFDQACSEGQSFACRYIKTLKEKN